jgi:hypothetical protein
MMAAPRAGTAFQALSLRRATAAASTPGIPSIRYAQPNSGPQEPWGLYTGVW